LGGKIENRNRNVEEEKKKKRLSRLSDPKPKRATQLNPAQLSSTKKRNLVRQLVELVTQDVMGCEVNPLSTTLSPDEGLQAPGLRNCP
jgi:predicted ATP-dependent Lon-type protease